MIQENLNIVREHIKQACLRSGREEKDVTLICVSKGSAAVRQNLQQIYRQLMKMGNGISEKIKYRK